MTMTDSVESAYLRARARFLLFIEEAEKSMEAGDADLALSIIDDKLSSLPADVQARSREAHPEAWGALDVRRQARKKGTNAN